MVSIGVFQKLFAYNEILQLRAVLHCKSMVKRDWYVWLKYLISLPQTDVKWEPEDYVSRQSIKRRVNPGKKPCPQKREADPRPPRRPPPACGYGGRRCYLIGYQCPRRLSRHCCHSSWLRQSWSCPVLREPLSRGQSPHPVLYVLNSTKTVLLFSSFVGRIRKFLIKKLKKDIKIGL